MCQIIKILVGFIILVGFASAQVEIVPVRTDIPPILDGSLDDEVWHRATAYDGFKTFQPNWGNPPTQHTVAYAAYDAENLFFAIEAFDMEPEKIKAAVSKWDNLYQDDWVGVGLDALNDQQSAYAFVVNGLGSQGDLMLDPGGDGDPAEDFIWDAAGALTENGYVVELKVPLQTIRYEAGRDVTMGLFFVRQFSRSSEMAIFPEIFPDKGSLLAQAGQVVYRDLKYRRTYEILPSFTQSANSELEDGELVAIDEESRSDMGVTAKVGISPTLTLDLTYNPDFSQIESDASQVDVNLRYPNFYSEKRPFFLEGIKNFDVAGIGDNESSAISTLVHTRTIADPLLGLKLTGKLGRKNAVAALITRDESTLEYDADEKRWVGDPADFGILRYKRLLVDESYIGGIAIARQHPDGYNRIAGIDGYWRLSGTMFVQGNALYELTEYPEQDSVGSFYNYDLEWSYGDKDYYFNAGIHDISRNFLVETGYVPRDGTRTVNFSARRTFYLESPLVQQVNVGCWGFGQLDKYAAQVDTGDIYDGLGEAYLRIGMPRSTWVEFEYMRGSEIYQGTSFDRDGWELGIESQVFKWLFMTLETGGRGSPWYEDDPYQGDTDYGVAFTIFQPTENFNTELMLYAESFDRRSNGNRIYDVRLLRTKMTYQANKYLFFRGIADYTDYNMVEDNERSQSLIGELLLGFTYFPGTVIYLGYGSIFGGEVADPPFYPPVRDFEEQKRGLFFKASYNWRL